jgi:hypothetical protein
MLRTVGNATKISDLIDSAIILLSGTLAWEAGEPGVDKEHSMASVEPSVWPTLINPGVLRHGYHAVQRMGTLARIFESQPNFIPYSSPFIPLCLFLALRFIIVTRNFPGGKENLEDASSLRRALNALTTLYPVAGISSPFETNTKDNISIQLIRLKGMKTIEKPCMRHCIDLLWQIFGFHNTIMHGSVFTIYVRVFR